MCGRYALTTPSDVLAKLLEITSGSALGGYALRYNLAPSEPAPVIRLSRDGTERSLDLLQWGLVPFWADDPKVGYKMINARSETAAEKPAYRRAFERRRCVVPADGFYEWQKLHRAKQPYLIRRIDGDPMIFAGLWDRWRGQADEPVDTFTILTTAANDQLRPLHDRMPVILEPEDVESWLDPAVSDAARLGPLLRPAADGVLTTHPVSVRVNKPENDDPSLLEPVEAPVQQPDDQIGLFG